MEYAIRDAKTHLSVRFHERGGIDLDKLDADRRHLGIEDASPEEAEAMIVAFRDPALSRRVLGLEGEG